MSQEHQPAPGEGVKFTDRRRVDPVTGAVREPPSTVSPADRPDRDLQDQEPDLLVEDQQGDLVEGDLDLAAAAVAEVTADLQRVHAEYANYRKRVERDRESIKDLAVGAALGELLPVLDDVGRARDHGDLEGAFKSVAESFESTVARVGLERYGVVGDPFDPTIHEAISHELSTEVTGPTCTTVFQPGYRYKGRVLRPAIVAVSDPES